MGKQLSFIVDFAIKISIYRGFPIALSDCQRVKNDFLRGKMENQPSECRSIISVPMNLPVGHGWTYRGKLLVYQGEYHIIDG